MRIPIRYNTFARVLLTLVGAPPSWSYLETRGDAVDVRMSWAFRATFPRDCVASVERRERRTISLGAHGFGGRALVNGAWSPLATITLREPTRAWLAGIPIRLRELTVSVDDPDALRAELLPAPVL
jgi:hypothetical protein